MRNSKLSKFAVLAAVLALMACNTVEGVGKDVQSAGDAVEGAAK